MPPSNRFSIPSTESRARHGFPFIGAVENMQIHYGPGQSEILDVFGLNGHQDQWREDLQLFREAGGYLLRYPIPWHRIEQVKGEYDWRWLDQVLRHARDLGIQLIVDPCHMKSFPLWLHGGFLDPAYPGYLLGFVQRLTDRYPWLSHWTPFNEPISSALLWGRTSKWCRDGHCDSSFVRTLVHICQACSLVAGWLRQDSNTCLMHVEAIEHHQTWPRTDSRWDAASEDLAHFHNERALLATEILLGRVHESHELYPYLQSNGFTAAERDWFLTHPAPFDLLGWDYYAHVSEHFWQRADPGWQRPGPQVRGLLQLLQDRVLRYPGYDIWIGETNMMGFVTDRLTWLNYATSVAIDLQSWLVVNKREESFRGLCWFPSFDSHSWTEAEMAYVTCSDPNGIWWIDEKRRRHPSELSQIWSQLSRGLISVDEIPIYPFNPDLQRDLQAFKPLLPDRAFSRFRPDLSGGLPQDSSLTNVYPAKSEQTLPSRRLSESAR